MPGQRPGLPLCSPYGAQSRPPTHRPRPWSGSRDDAAAGHLWCGRPACTCSRDGRTTTVPTPLHQSGNRFNPRTPTCGLRLRLPSPRPNRTSVWSAERTGETAARGSNAPATAGRGSPGGGTVPPGVQAPDRGLSPPPEGFAPQGAALYRRSLPTFPATPAAPTPRPAFLFPGDRHTSDRTCSSRTAAPPPPPPSGRPGPPTRRPMPRLTVGVSPLATGRRGRFMRRPANKE